jgi:hypothetical protein
MRKVVAALVALVCLPVVMLLLGGSVSGGPTPGCGLPVVASGPVDDSLGLTGPIPPQGTQSFFAPVDTEQTAITGTVVGVVKGRGLPLRAAVLTVAAGAQESKLHNLDYGDRDSVGFLQQRPSQGWGTPEQIRDVAYAAGKFLDGLVQVSGWQTMAATAAIQRVQRSGFPLAYAQWEQQAIDLVGLASGAAPIAPGGAVPAGAATVGCPQGNLAAGAATADGPVIPPGLVVDTSSWAPQPQNLPDPTGTGGRVTQRTADLVAAVKAAGYGGTGITCWDRHAWNPTSDHPLGLACDVMFVPYPGMVPQGWAAANWLVANQAKLGIHYLIWNGRYWSATNPTEWTPYHSSIYGCPNPAHVTGCHYDHVHVSLY